jgi:hypothetical protein
MLTGRVDEVFNEESALTAMSGTSVRWTACAHTRDKTVIDSRLRALPHAHADARGGVFASMHEHMMRYHTHTPGCWSCC